MAIDKIPIGDESGESWNIVPSMDVQADMVGNLVNSMAQSNLGQTPSGPSDNGDGKDTNKQKPAAWQDLIFGNGGNNTLAKTNSDIVTRAIANQGQLLPMPGQQTGGGSSNKSDDDMKKVLNAVQQASQQSSDAAATSAPQSSGGGGGGILSDIGTVVSAAAMWIICTELVRQGKMPLKWYIAGGPVFVAYPEIGKRGYYLWAIPSVRHLRRSPNSLYSRFLTAIFLWRAENIAAYRGVKGARKLIRGAAVTAVLYPVCLFLGYCLWLLGKNMDWMQVYGEKA